MSEYEKQIRKWLTQIAIKGVESMWLDQKYYLTIRKNGSLSSLFTLITLTLRSASLDKTTTRADIKSCEGCAQECVEFYLNAIAEFERETVAMNKGPKSKVVETQEIGRAIRAGQSRYHGQIIAFLDEIASGKLNSNASIILGEEFVVCVTSRAEAVDVSVRRRYTNDYHDKYFSGPALTDTVCAWIEEKLSSAIASSPKAVEEDAGSTKEVRENQIGRFLPPGWDGRIGNFLLDWFDGKFRNNASAVLLIEDKDNLRNFSIAILNSSGVGTTAAEVKLCGSNPVHLRQFPVGVARSAIHGWISEKIRELGFPPTPTPFREDGQDVLAAPQQSWVEQLYHDRLANKDRDCPPLDALGKPLQKPVPPPAPPCETVMDTLRLDTIGAMSKHVHDTKVAIKHLQEDLVIYERQLEEKIRGKCPDHPF